MSVADLEYLRLFPLSLVLFPGISVPLHIFEDRYKLMIGQCLADSKPFGVVLTRDSDEQAADRPHAVGTTAQITHVEELTGGSMDIIVQGVQRFRIVDLVAGQPYMAANVEILQPVKGSLLAKSELQQTVSLLFSQYIGGLVKLSGRELERVELPDDVEELSSVVASLLAIPLDKRQELLEELDMERALESEADLLREQIEQLSLVLTESRPKAYQFSWEKHKDELTRN